MRLRDAMRSGREAHERRLSALNVITNRRSPAGPGTELKKLLHKLRINARPGCKCNEHAVEMDSKGIDWCRQNIDIIVGWLKEEAARSKLPFTEIGAKILIRRAIRNAARAVETAS